MTKTALLMMTALSVAPLFGQDAQKIANELNVPEIKAGAKQLVLPSVPGAKVELLGADYEQLINSKGKISPVLEDTPVNLSFKVTKDGKEAVSKDYEVILKATSASSGNPKPKVIPEILQWKGGSGAYKLGDVVTIWCSDSKLRDKVAADLKALGKKVKFAKSYDAKADISFGLHKTDSTNLGDEGYRMLIGEKGIRITAETAVGQYWGTRTLLQMMKQNDKAVPCGAMVDIPRYKLRGFMFDIARTPYSLKYLHDIVDIMAWYKMNDLHLVINNNFIFHEHYVDNGKDSFKELYSAFRLESNAKGKDGTPLTATDLFYTKKQFMDLITYAKERGVRIVPEFDTPGHALSFTRLRPDLIYQGQMGHAKRRPEMLDAGNPETVKFVTGIFDEYLVKDPKFGKAVFADSGVLHVGADEFYGGAKPYCYFANELLTHVLKRGFTPRIWGSLSAKKCDVPVVVKGVQMNLWSPGWMNPMEAVNAGYDVINTHDGALYIVPFAGYYRMDKQLKQRYNDWVPNQIGNVRLPAGHPQLIGATFAIWNDETDIMHTGYGAQDLWPVITGSIDVLSQKMWGKAKAPQSFEEHRELVKAIGDAPCVNALYKWADNKPVTVKPGKLPMALNKPALGPNYHVTMEVELNAAPAGMEQDLLSRPEGKLLATLKDGTVGFRRDDTLEFSFGVKLPVGKKVKLELVAAPEKTKLFIDGKEEGEAKLITYAAKRADFKDYKQAPKVHRSTFVLPLKTVGESFNGKVYSLNVQPK